MLRRIFVPFQIWLTYIFVTCRNLGLLRPPLRRRASVWNPPVSQDREVSEGSLRRQVRLLVHRLTDTQEALQARLIGTNCTVPLPQETHIHIVCLCDEVSTVQKPRVCSADDVRYERDR